MNVNTARTVQQGFTLLEILIALVILSVGLLGLAGLQLNGLRSNQDSYYLTQAMAQAYDMADRMRANMAGYGEGDYNNIAATVPASPSKDCATSTCSALEMAQYDAYQWNTANDKLLPQGIGMVCTTPSPATCNSNPTSTTRYVIVMWDQLRNGVTGTACSGDLTKDRACFQTSFHP